MLEISWHLVLSTLGNDLINVFRTASFKKLQKNCIYSFYDKFLEIRVFKKNTNTHFGRMLNIAWKNVF